MKKLWLALLGMAVHSATFATPELMFLSEENPPVNYQDARDQPAGFAVELLNLIWQNLEQPKQPIHFMPWARAFYLAKNQNNTVIFATSRVTDRENQFKWVCPISFSDVVIIARRQDTKFQNTSLDKLNIGVIRSDIAEDVINQLAPKHSKLMKASSIEQLLRLLENKKVDVIATYSAVAYTSMQYINMDPADYPILRRLYEQLDCFAFNKNVDDKTIQEYQSALDKVRQSPAYESLTTRYHMLIQKQ